MSCKCPNICAECYNKEVIGTDDISLIEKEISRLTAENSQLKQLQNAERRATDDAQKLSDSLKSKLEEQNKWVKIQGMLVHELKYHLEEMTKERDKYLVDLLDYANAADKTVDHWKARHEVFKRTFEAIQFYAPMQSVDVLQRVLNSISAALAADDMAGSPNAEKTPQ